MKDELKTLKDIDDCVILTKSRKIIHIQDSVYKDELKAEAVKWVKKYKQDGDKQYTILFIRQFFNLTEDDIYYENMKEHLTGEDLK